MKRVIVSLMAATLLIAAPEASQEAKQEVKQEIGTSQEVKQEVKVSNETNTTKPQEEKKKSEFKLKDGDSARVFFNEFVKTKEIKKATVALNNLDLDKNVIKITVPTVFDCEKSEIKNGTFMIEKDIDVIFNFCAFKDLVIENTSDRSVMIEKSIGELTIKGKKISLNTVKLDKLFVIENVPNIFIDNSLIGKIILSDLKNDDTTKEHGLMSIHNSKNIFISHNIMDGNAVNGYKIDLDIENSTNIELDRKLYMNGKIFNSEVKIQDFKMGSVGGYKIGKVGADILNSHIIIENFYDVRDNVNFCVYHNNIEINGKIERNDKLDNFKNNIIKFKGQTIGLLEENIENIMQKKDDSKNLTNYNGLALSEDQVPNNYIKMGTSIKTKMNKCNTTEKTMDRYTKFYNYDFNGKKRDLDMPTPGQYEPTKEVATKTYDFSNN